MSLQSGTLAKFVQRIVRLPRDRRGSSAVEFALIAPVLILMYVGAVETGNLLTIGRRTTEVASTASDLTAQVKTVAASDLKDIESAASSIMAGIKGPPATMPITIVLTSVVADANNNGKVAWSCANKGAARAVGSAYALPTGITDPNTSVIVAEVTYAFTPLVNLTQVFSPGTFNIKRTFYARPRRGLTVKKTDGTAC